MNNKYLIVVSLMLVTIALCFGLPKSKYKSPNVLPSLNIPMEFAGWKAKDISADLKQMETYNFISNIFARVYHNDKGQELLLMILDAGNFHNPKVCYGASGFISNDMPDTVFSVPIREIKATTISLSKDKTNLVVIYWLCINQKLVGWFEQKVQELFYSILNQQKTGLMVRIDVFITKQEAKPQAVKLAQSFINDLSKQLSRQDLNYIFGK